MVRESSSQDGFVVLSVLHKKSRGINHYLVCMLAVACFVLHRMLWGSKDRLNVLACMQIKGKAGSWFVSPPESFPTIQALVEHFFQRGTCTRVGVAMHACMGLGAHGPCIRRQLP